MLKKLIRELFTFPPSEADRPRKALATVNDLHADQLRESDEVWREQVAGLINEQCRERSQWAKERRELHHQLATCKEQHGLCLAEVASGQRKELPLAKIADLQRTPLPKDHKAEGYELIAEMPDHSFRTLDVVIGSDYGTAEQMTLAMDDLTEQHLQQMTEDPLRVTWELLSDD